MTETLKLTEGKEEIKHDIKDRSRIKFEAKTTVVVVRRRNQEH
jgi:hypothetical protein